MNLTSIHKTEKFDIVGNRRTIINCDLFKIENQNPEFRDEYFKHISDEDIIDRKIIFMFIYPSEYLYKQMYLYDKKGYNNKIDCLNEITNLPYFYDEGITPTKGIDFKHLGEVLKEQ